MDRFKKFVKLFYAWSVYSTTYMDMKNKIVKTHFPPGTPSPDEMNKNTDLLFVNSHYASGYTGYSNPFVITIGGLICKPAKPLPEDLEEFITGSGEHGVIYFSLGGTVPGCSLSAKTKTAVLNVFRKLPQRVILKWEKEITDLPDNVRIFKWLPQQDILGHKQVKLFITQGGALSIQEAMYHSVPVLVLPIIVDQHTNAYLAQKLKYGRTQSICDFKENEFLENIQEIIKNPIYRENAMKISLAMRDYDINPSDKVKYWVEYIIRHNGTSSFRQVTKNYTWMYTIESDILLALIFIFVFSCMALVGLSIMLVKCLRYLFHMKITIKAKIN